MAQRKRGPKPKGVKVNPTKEMYATLYAAYDHFNQTLFDGVLPACMLLVHRKRNAHGYYWKDQWRAKNGRLTQLPEIALNPETMGRDIQEVFATLVHEQAHAWDAIYGKVPTYGHSTTWANKMEAVGLMPSTTGKPGGKRTGRAVTHYIIDDGLFTKECAKLLKKKNIDILWFAEPAVKSARKKDMSKVKYSCDCTNMWAKTGLLEVHCGQCGEYFHEQ